MKHHSTTRGLLLAPLALGLMLGACKKKSDDSPATRSLGLSGTDRPDTVPHGINYSAPNIFGNSNENLPAAVDLVPYYPPIGDQGQYGTCVAWATAYNTKTALESIKYSFTDAQKRSPDYQLSPRDLYLNIDDASKNQDPCTGTSFVSALDVVLNRGVATLTQVPYDMNGNCSYTSRNADWDALAAKHKIANYRRIDPTVLAIKQALFNKTPVILGAKLDDSFMRWNSDAVYSTQTTFDQVGIHAGHALCIAGYDDSRGNGGAFKIINSWSPNWGDNGYMWADYNFTINTFAQPGCFFVASNDEQAPPTPGPGPNPGPDPQPTPTGVDVLPWVYTDNIYADPEYPSDRARRKMTFDIFNIGSASAPVTSDWGFAYVYYKADDANQYGVIFYDKADASVPTGGEFTCSGTTCAFNTDLPGDQSLALELGAASTTPWLEERYSMPSITGDYYLVMIADVTGQFAEEDESNNIFYVTDQYPLHFTNGRSDGRLGLEQTAMRFVNPIKTTKPYKMASATRFQTAQKNGRMNTYSPKEIVSMLKDRARSGDLAQKIAQYASAHGSHTSVHGR